VYKDVFSEIEVYNLFNAARIIYTIDLRSESESLYGLIYKFSESELEIFRNYLAENMEKDWIRKLFFLAGAFIFFVKKPNKNLRLYIDYRALNKFIIKNRYPLLLIDEIID
jgi:hypothetical protein